TPEAAVGRSLAVGDQLRVLGLCPSVALGWLGKTRPESHRLSVVVQGDPQMLPLLGSVLAHTGPEVLQLGQAQGVAQEEGVEVPSAKPRLLRQRELLLAPRRFGRGRRGGEICLAQEDEGIVLRR